MANGIFKENVVIITGASMGIGRELALQLADQGAWLALAARNANALEQLAAKCRQRGARALAVAADVTVEADCQRIVDTAVAEYGRLDTLVNNAGQAMWARFEEMQTLDPFEQLIKTNYLGSVYTTFYALPYLKQTQGRIVALSSLAGKVGVPLRSGYSAAKFAVAGFFDALRVELGGSGVSVTVVYPGFVSTGARQRNFGPDGKALGAANSPVREEELMPVEECVRIMLRAIARRQREELMSFRASIGLWLKLIAPRLVDRIALRSIERGK